MNTSPAPAITVIMSVYNGERYVREAVDSILGQTFADFEFVIIDDASTDDTANIVRSYRDRRIIIVRNEKNIGLTRSLNIGLAMARGAYIARMDADDIALPDRLALEKSFLDDNPDIVGVGGETDVMNEAGQHIGVKRVLEDPELIRFRMVFANQIAHPTILFRKKIIVENGGYNENFTYAQDYELWSCLSERNYRFANIATPVLQYRYHARSITQGSDSKSSAYACAAAVIRKNISRYIACTDENFSAFLKSLHWHRVDSFRDAMAVLSFWSHLKKAYLKKEMLSPENKDRIRSYVAREQRGVLQWYAKQHFGILYAFPVRILKLITSDKK